MQVNKRAWPYECNLEGSDTDFDDWRKKEKVARRLTQRALDAGSPARLQAALAVEKKIAHAIDEAA